MITKRSLLELLADNRMDSVFEELKSRQGHYNDLVLLESQWKDLQSRQRSGTISGEQANLEAARVRKSLLELIELSFTERHGKPVGGTALHSPQPSAVGEKPAFPLRTVLIAAAALLICLLLAFVFFPMLSNKNGKQPDETHQPAAAPGIVGRKPAKARTLNISAAEPLTLNPGDVQYEETYSVIEGKVESVGGGQSLVTLKVGLNFKGIINDVLSSNDFRLVADGLRGPLAPANFLSVLVDSKSYGEGELKFELSDTVTRFSVVLKNKEHRKWDFSIE